MPPSVAFLIALALLALFIWYFGTDSDKRQRHIGSFLVVGLLGFCLYALIPPSEKIKLGMDLAGGVRYTLELNAGERTITTEDQQQAQATIQRRLEAEVPNADIQVVTEGEDRIVVDIPNRSGDENNIGTKELEKIENQLTTAAQLTFHLTHPEDSRAKAKRVADGDDIALDGIALPHAEDMLDDDEEPYYVLVNKEPSILGKWVTGAGTYLDNKGWVISLSMKGEGAEALAEISTKYARTNTRMAIVMDGEVLSHPVFNEPLTGGGCTISGDFSKEAASALATSMQNPLETKPEILFKEYFSPKLAKSAIDQGLRAGIWGLAITALFMLVFYRFAGIIAVLGLGLNVVLLFGVLAIFKSDFTLTGIAGVILTIGIAVDANVLIYERLREERKAGKSVPAAIQAAYEKAFSAIFDAQITSLITAVILLSLAAGAIKGFAVTLAIGIVVSLFAALLFTRVCFNWLIAGNKLQKLGFMETLTKTKYDFLGAAKLSKIISFALIIISVAIIAIRGGSSLGIEFSGGDQIRFVGTAAATEESVEEAINQLELTSTPDVQALTPVGSDDQTFTVRVEAGKGAAAKQAVLDAGFVAPGDNGEPEVSEQTIGSAVAGEMAKSSLVALFVGLCAIFIYIAFRFEYSFAIGAIVALVHDLVICIGITVLSGRELNLILVGAFLTIAGYSINDTIVVFDRIREGLLSKRGDVKDIMNLAINSTLSRTILTGVTTLFTVASLFLFGGEALSDFSFAIILGLIVGTYSSIFVASPIVHWWAKKSKTNLRREVMDADQESVTPATGA